MSSKIGKIYETLYTHICGHDTKTNILHFQYLATYQLHKHLKKILRKFAPSSILDLGCGTKPYKKYFRATKNYIGADLYQNGTVDVLLTAPDTLPFKDKQFDFILSTQVFEHVENLDLLYDVNRVLQKNGTFLISVPFLYHVHDKHDYRRFTKKGLEATLKKYGFKKIIISTQGGIGSTLGILILSFMDSLLNKNRFSRLFKGLILPFWILLSLVINILMILIDKLDNTGNYYNNILAVCEA